MRNLENEFKLRKISYSKLKEYGFLKENDNYKYQKNIAIIILK